MRVGILGCGYVGLELARQLVDAGHDVIGVRRSDDGLASVEETGATAIRADVTDESTLAAVPDIDALVFLASSGGRGTEAAREVYVDGLRAAIAHFGERERKRVPDRLVYASSTGVYGDHGGDRVDEGTPVEPTTDKTAVLAEAERIAIEGTEEYGIDGTVARFAGLYGPDRYRLSRYLDGPVTAGYLNMVHRADAAGGIRYFLERDVARGLAVNVADDEPADKWTFADWLADECGVDRPDKRTVEERLAEGDLSTPARRRLRTSKRVANDRLRELGYEFTYPTYREGYRAAVERFEPDE